MIEVATFRLRAGADAAAFAAADAAFQQGFVYRQPGLQRRTLALSPDGRWLALSLWASADAALDAEQAAIDDPHAAARAAFIEASTLDVARFDDLPG